MLKHILQARKLESTDEADLADFHSFNLLHPSHLHASVDILDGGSINIGVIVYSLSGHPVTLAMQRR